MQNIEREGEFLVNVKIIDFAGNFTETTKTYTVLLRPLREELISIIPDPENSDKLIVIGANSAAVPNNDVKIRSGFFTSDTIKSEANGSFRKTINFTNSVIVESTHPITNETGKYEIKYNIETTFSGIVKNVFDEPIPNVKVVFENSEIETTTGADGVFEFKNAPTGDHKLLFDATSVNYVSSSGVGHKYSKVAIALNLGLRQRNVLERPIYLTPSILDESSVQVLPENGATVTSEHAPGVVLEIPPDTIEFPSQDFDRVSIMEIPIERTSVTPPDYVIPETVIALEPSGTKFKERIKLTLPNVNELPEGTELVILSKNSEKGIWEIDGAAKVDDGGATITTEEGKGISHFSEVFAVPIVPHVFNPTSELKPGANTNFGSVSKTINLPSFKILGNDISPSLSYNSNWASPKALVSNTIAMPDFSIRFSDSQSGGIPFISYAKQGFKYKEWIEPSWISAQFFADGIYSQEMKYQGAPNVSTIAYNMDLSSLSSGIHSYSAKYKYKLKRMTISTFNYKKTGVLTGNVRYSSTFKETRELEKLFPSDVSGPLYVLNKSDSSLGSGWKFNIGSRILNPTEDRILIESQEGSLAQYNLNSKIETVFRTQSSLEGVTLSFPKIYYSKNNKIYSSDLTNSDAETEVSDLYKYSGSFGVHKSLWGGKCGICHLYRHPFTLSSIPNKFLHNPSDGITYYTADNGGIFSVENGLSQKFGNTRTPSSTGINWQLAWTSYPDCRYGYPGLSCSGIYEYGRYSNSSNNCGCNGSSGTGSWPVNGFSDGEITSSLFNNPKDIIPSFSGGKIAIADYGNNRVRLLDPSLNTVTTIAGSGQNFDNGDGGAAIDASIYHPQALAYDKVGNLYIATENGYIRKVTPNGYISTFAGRPLGAGGGKLDYDVHASELGLTIPSDILIDSESEYMYISDTGNHRVIKLDMNSLQAKTIAGGSCVGDSSSPDSIVGDNASALGASLCNPKDLSFDSGGNLLVYDSGHGRVRRIVENVSNEFGTSFIPVLSDGSSLSKNVDGSFSLNLRDGRNIQYDNLGREILSDDKNGNSVSYEYEDNLLKRVNFLDRGNLYFNYSGGLLTSVVDHSGKETFFEYSGRQLVKVIFPDGSENNFSYTEDNHLTQSVDPAGRITNFIYNQNKSLIELKTPDGFSQKVNNILDEKSGNTIVNGEYGKLLSTAESKVSVNFTNPLNNTTTIFKDVDGFVSKFKDAQGKLTQIERDLEGRPLKITRPDNSFVEFEYSPEIFDLTRKLDSATGIEVKYVYNEAGLLLKTLESEVIVEENVFNEFNQLISKTNRLGQKVQYEYNSFGLVTKKIAPDLSFATFSYDAFGNIETSTDASGKVTTFTRDAAGNVISISNAEGQVVSREYDEFNRLTSVTSNKNEKTSYVYSQTGQLLSIVDPNLKVTSFEYNDMDRLVKKVDPVGRVVTLEYDANGNVTKETDPSGNIKTFAYNKLDKLTKKVLPDDLYEFEYDIRGNVSMVKNNITQINFEYDHLESGDVVTVAGTFGVGARTDLPSMDLEYEYDNHGNRTALIDGDEVTSYEFDIGDRLRKITNHKNEIFTFDYDSKNRLKLITRPGSETTYNFFNNDILSQILHKSGSTTISNFEYVVNNIGNITQKRTPAGNFDYGYDGNNQLTSATNPETIIDEIYQYDSLGNRTQDQNGNYTYDQTGQKLQEDYKNFYYYSDNGNLTSIVEKGTNKTKNYIYNSENRLIQFKEFDEGANLIRQGNYAYDALGRRIEKVVIDLQVPANNKTRRYVYDGEDIIKVFDESNNVLSKYTHSGLRIDDALAIDNKQDNKSYYFLKDHLGSIVDIVNEDNTFKQHYAYSSFGELQKVTDVGGNDITSNPILENHFAYTGREYDQESGLYHYRARAYDASTGRFLQVDPDAGKIGVPVTQINKYIYSANSPIVLKDPSGASFLGLSEDTWIDIGAAVATIAIIYASGGTAVGAYAAVGSTAIGSALAAGAMSYGQTGSFTKNFSSNFHTMFRIGLAFLSVSAVYGSFVAPAGSGIQAGGNGLTGYAGSNSMGAEYTANSWQGLNLTGNAASITGPGSLGIGHESMHTVQFIFHSYLAGRMERRNELNMSRWSFLYGSYLFVSTPGAVTGAY